MRASGGRESIGAALSDQGPGLHQGPHALLQEERVALGALDEQRRERGDASVVAEEREEQRLGGVQGQGVEPELRVVGLAAPAVLVLRTIVHEQQSRAAGRLSTRRSRKAWVCGVDPVEVLEDDEERLDLALAEQQRASWRPGFGHGAAGARALPLPACLHRDVQECEERREGALQRRIER